MGWSKSFEGGALAYVIYLGVVVSLITGMVFMAVSLNHRILNKVDGQKKIQLVLESVVEIVLAGNTFEEDRVHQINLFSSSSDDASVQQKPWGFMPVFDVRSFSGDDTVKTCFTAGALIPIEGRCALKLEDRNRPLSLCGNTVIAGRCELPKAGVKRAYIEGKTFQGDQLINGSTTTVDGKIQLPAVSQQVKEWLGFLDADSIQFSRESVSNNSFFSEDYRIIDLAEGLYSDLSVSGYLLTRCLGTLILDSSSTVQDAIVLARSIHFKEGFRGAGQFIAMDSIVLERGVKLEYPTIVYVNHEQQTGSAQVVLKDESSVSGAIIMDAIASRPGVAQSIISIDQKAFVEGQLISNVAIDLKGTVYGMVQTPRFLLRTPSSVYENHLLDATINADFYQDYVFALPQETRQNKSEVMKWLY